MRSAPLWLATPIVAGLLATPAAAQAWPTWDGEAPWEFRSGRYDAGEFVYSNGIHLNKGANVDGIHHEEYYAATVTGGELPIDDRDDVYRHLTYGAFGAERGATNGDYELPLDREAWPDFTADLAELRLRVDGDDLLVRWRFTSMPRPDAQIATLAFATAGGGATAAAWPHGAAIASSWETAITVWGTAGTVTDVGDPPTALVDVGGAVRAGDHVVEARVPLSELPAGPWELTGGAGLADPDDPSSYWEVPPGNPTDTAPGSGFATSSGNVWSLLFADDDPWVFSERRQADLLASGDVSDASIVVDPALLASGHTTPIAQQTGRTSRFYASAFDFGDGITRGGGSPPAFLQPPPGAPTRDVAVSYEYTGRLQPYSLYVPTGYAASTGGWPLVLYLHGLNNYIWEPFGVVVGLDAMLEERGYLLAGLLGRGDLSYRGRGELDVMEALADIQRHYRVDADRIYLMGHSMGSIGTHNVSTRNPDLFGAVAPSQIAASGPLAENLRHVPWLMMTSVQDPLDPVTNSAQDMYARLSGLGYDARLVNYLAKTHESSATYDTLPAIFDTFDRAPLVRDPAEVRYARLPDDDHADLGLVHDGAYWVDGMQPADAAGAQRLHATSHALGEPVLDPAAATRVDEPVDMGGPSGRSAAILSTTTPAFTPAPPARNAATLDLDNLAGVTLDLDRMQLTTDGLSLEVDSTDEVVLRLRTTDAATRVLRIDGAEVGDVAPAGGVLAISLPSGQHTAVLGARTAAAAPPPLPATGGGAAAAGALLVAAGLLRARRR